MAISNPSSIAVGWASSYKAQKQADSVQAPKVSYPTQFNFVLHFSHLNNANGLSLSQQGTEHLCIKVPAEGSQQGCSDMFKYTKSPKWHFDPSMTIPPKYKPLTYLKCQGYMLMWGGGYLWAPRPPTHYPALLKIRRKKSNSRHTKASKGTRI